MDRTRTLFFAIIGITLLVVGGVLFQQWQGANVTRCVTEISILYAPEEKPYMEPAIEKFNALSENGKNPVTEQSWQEGDCKIVVSGKDGSSGTVAQGIVNSFVAPTNKNVERPTIFSPSTSLWLSLVNYQAGRNVFDVANAPATAKAPVVIAIWESRLRAIEAKNGGQPVGWEELIEVFNSPNGWADYGLGGMRTTVYYGHTNPLVSSTALSTLIAEFSASAQKVQGSNFQGLTLDDVRSPEVQQNVRNIEKLVRHYAERTTEFKEYIARGPEYLDFVALEENDLISINRNKASAEKLIALYPKEGTFMHEHPFAIPMADWVTPEQKSAAEIFTQYILTEEVQRQVLENGLRPVNPNVPIGSPISPEFGADPSEPLLISAPSPELIVAVQNSWQFVQKQSDVLLLIDVSGSMYESGKLDQAKQAARAFIEATPLDNKVGLLTFSESVDYLVPLDLLSQNKEKILTEIQNLNAYGDTALYDVISESIKLFQDSGTDDTQDRIRGIVVLSDGQDTASKNQLHQVEALITSSYADRNPIITIPIAYGKDADTRSLNSIAIASKSILQNSDPDKIESLLTYLASYFGTKTSSD